MAGMCVCAFTYPTDMACMRAFTYPKNMACVHVCLCLSVIVSVCARVVVCSLPSIRASKFVSAVTSSVLPLGVV
jgi:uncharacterized membrane protein YhdT